MRVDLVIQRLLWICTISITACETAPSYDWVLLSEDSEGKPTFIDAADVRWVDEGVAIYRRAVGEPDAADRLEFVQALDCVNLRWAFLTLDESRLDSMADANLSPEEWSMVALNPANRALVDELCEGHSPARWLRVQKRDSDEPGDLKEVWVDRESITGPTRDSVWTETESVGYSEEVLRSWSRWLDASPDRGYLMIQADVACDLGFVRYLENSRYSWDGELVRQFETTDTWTLMFRGTPEREVFGAVCSVKEFFGGLTPETSHEGG
jgi:hypothetical protein